MTMHRMPPKIDTIKLSSLSLSVCAAEPESVLSVVFVSLISFRVLIVVFIVGADVGSIMRDNHWFIIDGKVGAIDGIFDVEVVCDAMGDIKAKLQVVLLFP